MTPRRKTERTAVVDAALALADREGLDSVTIRGVADEVGVAPMSLYTHFDKKEELIDFMFARLLERIFETADPLTWQEGLEAGARSARATLQAHPSWIPLLTRTAVPVSSLRPFERELKLMRKDGLTLETSLAHRWHRARRRAPQAAARVRSHVALIRPSRPSSGVRFLAMLVTRDAERRGASLRRRGSRATARSRFA